MHLLARFAHHLILVPTVFFTYAMVGADSLAAAIIAIGGIGLWLHMHGHSHAVVPHTHPLKDSHPHVVVAGSVNDADGSDGSSVTRPRLHAVAP